MEEKLNKLYNDPSNHVAFAGAKPLYNEAQKIDHTITNKDVRNFLQGHRTYSLMRPRRVRFPRAKTIPSGFLSDCQIDLAGFFLFLICRENIFFKFRYAIAG
jgi:hypothetical protein